MKLTFTEEYLNGMSATFNIKKHLFSGQSEFQKIDILETEKLGNMMLLDGVVMLTEANEHAYHEMIAHVPVFSHPNPERVLIIGGGDGGTAREVMRHPCVKECIMCEIDGMVVDAAKEFFPTLAVAFNHPKMNLIIDDGIKYIQENKNSFDVIIIDSTDPEGPAEGLFKAPFYRDVFNALREGGIMSAQAESPYEMPAEQKAMFAEIDKVFPFVTMYLSFIPFYPTGMWSFAFASKGGTGLGEPRLDDIEKMQDELKYFNIEIMTACFALPNFVTTNLAG
jgi:spermidine synthase